MTFRAHLHHFPAHQSPAQLQVPRGSLDRRRRVDQAPTIGSHDTFHWRYVYRCDYLINVTSPLDGLPKGRSWVCCCPLGRTTIPIHSRKRCFPEFLSPEGWGWSLPMRGACRSFGWRSKAEATDVAVAGDGGSLHLSHFGHWMSWPLRPPPWSLASPPGPAFGAEIFSACSSDPPASGFYTSVPPAPPTCVWTRIPVLIPVFLSYLRWLHFLDGASDWRRGRSVCFAFLAFFKAKCIIDVVRNQIRCI